MEHSPARLRRARRTDFSGVMAVLADCNIDVPPADRGSLRRFRRIVADLGADFYVATVDERIVGFGYVTYSRQLTSGPIARVENLRVAPGARAAAIGIDLLRLLVARAQKRGAACVSAWAERENESLFAASGWKRKGMLFVWSPVCARSLD